MPTRMAAPTPHYHRIMTSYTLLAIAFGLGCGAAQAGTLQISITDKDGKPAPDVVVLAEPATRMTPGPAPAPVLISQENLRFAPFLTIVPVGSMLRFVNRDVSGTPWFAKTDANGMATIDGIPDGVADLSLWHPDQLQEQAPQRLQVSAAPLQASGQLNFVPRRRKS